MSLDPAETRGWSAVVRPIGFVRNEIDWSMKDGWDKVVSQVVINGELEAALDGIEAFSHVIVLFWMHRPDVREPMQPRIHPRRRPDLPLVGLLATRTPVRPNPIGLACVPLLERKGCMLQVKNLDAMDGTPVVDVKPYIPGSDAIPDAAVAGWVHRIEAEL